MKQNIYIPIWSLKYHFHAYKGNMKTYEDTCCSKVEKS